MTKLYPVLLAGGSGTRLWPLSRKSYPKQFSKIIGNKTLFQASADRLLSSAIVHFARHITLTNADYRFIVCEQLQQIGIDPGPILIEPEAKNTAASIMAASIFAFNEDKDAVLLVAPSDHVIPDIKEFHKAIVKGLSQVQIGKIVTFGIKPSRPETGYGYLEFSPDIETEDGISKVLRFLEKPDLKDADKMVSAGNFLWNAGIFMFRAQDMLNAFKTFAPTTLDLVSKAVYQGSLDLGFLRLAAEPWSLLCNISIDYAIMEKIDNLVVLPYNSKWSDLGGWDAVWSESNPDLSGNVISETAHAINCANTLLRSESNSQQLIGIGLDETIAVAMPDAVLVAHKDSAQLIHKAVEILKSKDVAQAESFPKNYRPWGWYESLLLNDSFQVKRICVKPGAALSLQSHNYRSEHWVVVKGIAKVTIDKEVKLISEGQSVYVPLRAIHRLENPGKSPIVLIEVQIGTYLGEDDIIRYEDLYARV